MDGLECSEIKYSDIFIDNEKFRIDSEFFQKKYLKAYSTIKAKKHTKIANIYSTFTDFHSNGSYETIAQNFELLDQKEYAYMVRTADLEKENYTDSVKYVTKSTYDFLSKSKVYGGELLINKIGSPGRAFLMPKLEMPVSLGMNLFLLRFKEHENICEESIYIFFNTKIGKNIIERKINGTVPLTIDKEAIKSLYCPMFSQRFIEIIKNLIAKKDDILAKSKLSYVGAENELRENINFAPILSIQSTKTEKLFSDSFRISGRLDAEYYQPKYDALFDTLSKFPTKKLGGKHGIVSIVKSIEPGSEAYVDNGIPFIRVSDISKFEISEPAIKLVPTVIPTPETLFPKKDTILFSKDGSIGIAYKLEEDMKAITSGALLHLSVRNKDEILPDYLTLVLNSPIVQLQAERDCNGAVIQHWKPSEIENVIIPVLDIDVQEKIAAKVQESFALRKQSKLLLEYAKQAVEMAIEQGEETATRWLDSKMKEENYGG